MHDDIIRSQFKKIPNQREGEKERERERKQSKRKRVGLYKNEESL